VGNREALASWLVSSVVNELSDEQCLFVIYRALP
jgi:hypothetical protein